MEEVAVKSTSLKQEVGVIKGWGEVEQSVHVELSIIEVNEKSSYYRFLYVSIFFYLFD